MNVAVPQKSHVLQSCILLALLVSVLKVHVDNLVRGRPFSMHGPYEQIFDTPFPLIHTITHLE